MYKPKINTDSKKIPKIVAAKKGEKEVCRDGESIVSEILTVRINAVCLFALYYLLLCVLSMFTIFQWVHLICFKIWHEQLKSIHGGEGETAAREYQHSRDEVRIRIQ